MSTQPFKNAPHKCEADQSASGEPSMTLVVCLGLSQVIGWGAMHYLIAVFAAPMGEELNWSSSFVQGGFSLSLVAMALVSPAVGRWIDESGGRWVLVSGCLLGAAGCAVLASCRNEVTYLVGWGLLGLSMRMALYDAAFATLARVAGPSAKRSMAIVTLFGGLASTVFWPLGHFLEQWAGWRGALWAYAAILAMSSLLHLCVPAARGVSPASPIDTRQEQHSRPSSGVDVLLFSVFAVLVLFMQTGIAAHFIELIRGLGWSATTAGLVAALLGVGQLTGRTWVVLWGHRLHATALSLVPCMLLLLCYVNSLVAGGELMGVAAFAFLYGAGNGIATIARGALPLALFNPAQYGRLVGVILRPAFLLAAFAPVALAQAIERLGHRTTLGAMPGFTTVLLASSLALALRFSYSRRRHGK